MMDDEIKIINEYVEKIKKAYHVAELNEAFENARRVLYEYYTKRFDELIGERID